VAVLLKQRVFDKVASVHDRIEVIPLIEFTDLQLVFVTEGTGTQAFLKNFVAVPASDFLHTGNIVKFPGFAIHINQFTGICIRNIDDFV
jgi:hypothetical protein